MIGRTTHSADAQTKEWTEAGWRDRKPFVFLSNEEDGHYWQGFENWDELNTFIAKLRSAGTDAFGAEPPVAAGTEK